MSARIYLIALLAAAILSGVYLYGDQLTNQIRKNSSSNLENVQIEKTTTLFDENNLMLKKSSSSHKNKTQDSSSSKKNKTQKTKTKHNKTVELDTEVETDKTTINTDDKKQIQISYYKPRKNFNASDIEWNSFNFTLGDYTCFVYPNCTFGTQNPVLTLKNNTVLGILRSLGDQIALHAEHNETQFYTWDKQAGLIYYPPSVNAQCKPTPLQYGMMCAYQSASAILQYSFLLLSILSALYLF